MSSGASGRRSPVDWRRLGFIFLGYGGQIRVSPKSIRKFKDRVREITRRNRGVSMTHRYDELRRYFQGWVGYFHLVPIKSFFSDQSRSCGFDTRHTP